MRSLPFLLIAGLALLFLMPEAVSESGGPDSFGYTFKDSNETDGPTYNWIDISSNGTAINITSEGPHDLVVGPYELGFNFFFYGECNSNSWGYHNLIFCFFFFSIWIQKISNIVFVWIKLIKTNAYICNKIIIFNFVINNFSSSRSNIAYTDDAVLLKLFSQ